MLQRETVIHRRASGRTGLKAWVRALVSAFLAAALMVSAIPFSAVLPAYANEGAYAAQTEDPGQAGAVEQSAALDPSEAQELPAMTAAPEIIRTGEHISAVLPLDGSTVDAEGNVTPGSHSESSAAIEALQADVPQTEEEKQAILDGYLADGTISEDDLDNEFITKSLTGEYLTEHVVELSSADPADLEQTCGNSLDGHEAVEQEMRQKEEEADKLAEQAVETGDAVTEETVEESLRAAAEEEAALPVAADPAFAGGPEVLPLSASAASDLPYSTKVVLKDISAITLYSGSGVAMGFRDTHLNSNQSLYAMYVKCYRMPSFYAPVKSARVEGGKAYVTFSLPGDSTDTPQDFEVLYSTDISSSGYVYPSSGRFTVNDTTVLVNLAQVPGYDASRDHAYLNAYRLAPFASYEDIVKSGNAIPADSRLFTSSIQELWPIHEEKGMKVSLLKGEEEGVVRFEACFSDGVSEVYDLDYLGMDSLAASYVTRDTGVLYQPDFWVIGESGQKGVDRVASFIRSKTYNGYFAPLKSDVKMHRTVRDYFDRNIHANAEEVAANLLTNIEGWVPTYTDARYWQSNMNLVESAQPLDDWESTAPELKMFNLLFLYTYWERFLNIDIGGSEELGARKDANMFLVMAFRGSVIKSGCSLVNMTYMVQSRNMLTFSMVRQLSKTVVNTRLAPFTGIYDATTLVSVIVSRTTGYADLANWFADYMSTIAFYHEYKPVVVDGYPETGELYWRGWDQTSRRYPDLLLLWLTMEPGAMYMASSSLLLSCGSTYTYQAKVNDAPIELNEANRASFQARLDRIFQYCTQYSSTVATIVGKERVNTTDILVLDNMTSFYDTGTRQNVYYESHGLWGKLYTEDPWHKNFFDVSELYDTTGGQGASAASYNFSPTNKRILFQAYTALSCPWSYEWSHELAHGIDNDVFLGAARRDGATPEDFTDGLLTQGHGMLNPVLNLSYDYDISTDRMSNYEANRIYGKDNTNDFYSKVYEAIDVLDYAALQAFLRLDKDEQNAVASQVRFSGQNGTSAIDYGNNSTTLCSRNKVLSEYDGTTATMTVNESVFNDGSKRFETVEEVYDNQVFLRPGIPESGSISWGRQLYVSEDNRGSWWFPVHANTFYPDSRSFKVMMYRMLGREGYDAFATYGSAGGNDLQKLKQITGFDSYKEWQMDTWSQIEAKKDSLGYVSFDDLVDKFEAALKTDAENNDRNLGAEFALRTRMFYLMKRTTNDFQYGIYENQKPVTHIRTLQDLLAVADNPQGNFVLEADIDASSLGFEAGKALLAGTFYGKLDGQGHKVYSTEEPLPYLFESMRHAYVKDLELDGVVTDVISSSITNSELENISYTRFERNIYSVDDFLGITDDLQLGVKTFHLKADLDFTAWSAENEAAEAKQAQVITRPLVGTLDSPKILDGGGHRITGLKGASLFGRVCFAEISDLTLENCENLQDATGSTRVGLLAATTYRCMLSDLFFNNVKLSARGQVGFVSGDDGLTNAAGQHTRDGGSRFSRIQVTNGELTVGTASTSNVAWGGFLTGILCFSSVEDVYVQGRLSTYGTKCGGVAGAISKSATLNRCVSNVNMDCQKSADNGVVVGVVEEAAFNPETTLLSNCIGLGQTDTRPDPSFAIDRNPLACSRFASLPEGVDLTLVNCYENANRMNGKSMVGDDMPGLGFVRTTYLPKCIDKNGSQVKDYLYAVPSLRNNAQFFIDLGFSSSVWEFDPTIQVGYPMLRFVGDRDTFYDYDVSMQLDFKNEELRITGSSVSVTSQGGPFYRTRIHGLPYRAPIDNYLGYMKGDWLQQLPTDMAASINVMFDTSGVCDLSEVIEYEGFVTEEVEQKGSRSVTLIQTADVLNKSHDLEMSIEIPPRPAMDCADRVRGVRASSEAKGGLGAIHFASIGIYRPSDLEYRLVSDEAGAAEGEGGDAEHAAAEAPTGWTTLPSAITPVPPGTYEVRIAATDHSFASYPTQVTVEEFDPDAVTFPLILEPNGGTWGEGYAVPDSYSSEEGLALPDAHGLTRDGYAFKGWYETPDFTDEPLVAIPEGREDPLVLYARWEPQAYAVSLHFNGGTLADPTTDVVRYTVGAGSALPVPERPYCDFAGWFDNEACEGVPVEAISPTDFGDKQYWAKWNTRTHVVTLRLQGASLPEGASNTLVYAEGVGLTLPDGSSFTFEGHSFKGWYDNKECLGSPILSIPQDASSDKELWAKWTADVYRVALAYNGGKLAVGETDVVSFQYGMETVLPHIERNGYEFDGWYDNPDFNGDPVKSIPVGEMGERSFWAKWVPRSYAIAFDLGMDEKGERPPRLDLSSYEGYTTGSQQLLPDASVMVWEGHTFAGWYESADFSGSSVTQVPADAYGDLAFYARWAGNACVISYHANGGTFQAPPETVFPFEGEGAYHEGDEVLLPGSDMLARKGYAFEGWYVDGDFSSEPVGSVFLEKGVIDLHAKWSLERYHISYELNGGAFVEGAALETSYNVESELVVLPSAGAVVREGYAFKGWSADATGESSVVTAIQKGEVGDKVFYALWEEEPVTPPGPTAPELTILSLSFGGDASQQVAWDDTGYGRVEVARSKMPVVAEDLSIEVPEGVEVVSITKREQAFVHPLVAFFFAAAYNEAESVFWDILLRQTVEPHYEKLYTLEVVPVDDGDDGDDGTGGSNAGEGSGGAGEGGGDNTGNAGNNGSQGNGNNSGNGNAGGSLHPGMPGESGTPGGSTNPGASGEPAASSAPEGSGEPPQAHDAQVGATPAAGNASTALPQTGDETLSTLLLMLGAGAAAFGLVLVARRRFP